MKRNNIPGPKPETRRGGRTEPQPILEAPDISVKDGGGGKKGFPSERRSRDDHWRTIDLRLRYKGICRETGSKNGLKYCWRCSRRGLMRSLQWRTRSTRFYFFYFFNGQKTSAKERPELIQKTPTPGRATEGQQYGGLVGARENRCKVKNDFFQMIRKSNLWVTSKVNRRRETRRSLELATTNLVNTQGESNSPNGKTL